MPLIVGLDFQGGNELRVWYVFFFFQAEDGIRDYKVTGVQTCALPISIGVLVGALTLGSALPHLVRWAVPVEHWRPVLIIAAAAAFVGGVLVLLVPHDGPFAPPAPPLSWRAAPRIPANRAVSPANLGYLGHMWELYAMSTWLAAFVAASELART